MMHEPLTEQLRWVVESSPLYRKKFADCGVDVLGRIDDPDLLRDLPFTEKDELRRSQEELPPLGGTQGPGLEELTRIQGTGGTTGTPMRIGFTRGDLEILDRVGAEAFRCAGLGPGCLVAECMNYSLYCGGVTDHTALEAAGCCVLPYSVGNSRRLIDLIAAMATPWALYSTPAYAQRLATVARDAGYDPRSLQLRRGVFSGDGGLTSPGFRRDVEETWGLTSRDVYGLSETGIVAAECDYQDGMHVVSGQSLLVELIDPVDLDRLPFEEGVEGELVFTTLRRRASYLVRFRSHDLVQVLAAPCPCGRSVPRIRVLGRGDDMFIVRGVNVFPLAVQDVLYEVNPDLGAHFQIILDSPPPIDYDPVIAIESDNPMPAVTAAITRAIKDRLNFSPRVELVPVGTIPRTDGKSVRLIRAYDQRPHVRAD